MKNYDLIIIGGGIIGTSTAMALSKTAKVSLAVMESEDRLAYHQSGHNSGVIHSGIYYNPGSLKAKLCTEGREAMYDFCKEHDIPHERCGKIIVATNDKQRQYLDTLLERGKTNGMKDIQEIDEVEIKKYEPHASGIAGIYVPYTGIVDYIRVVEKYGDTVRQNDGEIHLNSRVTDISHKENVIYVYTVQGEFQCKYIINCAGLYSDRVARMAGLKAGLQIIPFRGEYYNIKPEKRHLVRNLIYPVPDPRFPFLGVHFTRTVYGEVEAGPNAVLAFSRDAYKKTDFSLLELANMAVYRGFWKMAKKYWQTGLGEFYRSLDKSAFVRALNKLLPELEEKDIVRGGSGIRAQALEPDGSLVDDFRVVESEDMIHVLNAPSPAATASIKIGEYIANMAKEKFQL